jgi:carboxyl-terminal processing protease
MDTPPALPRYRSLPFLLVVLAFLAGIMVERLGWLPGSRPFVPANLGDSFGSFWEAWSLVERHYVDRDAVKPKEMTEGAIRGMLASLGDVGHTGYLTAEEFKQVKASLEGNMVGIGALMTMRKKQPTVVRTMPDSPARKAGLKAGDVLLEVDGKTVAGLPLEKVVEAVRGPAGTAVDLQIGREGTDKVLNFHLTRARVELPAIAWRMLPGVPIAHIAIVEFRKNADDQLREALKEARQRGAKGLIVDVRGNQGGLKEQAVAVSSEFLKDGVVFIEQDAGGNRKEVPVKADGTALDIPLVVLIDEGSASSSEIFAGAIQDHARGKLVGTKTFGTGTVLQPFILKDGSAILMAVAEWLTPKGRQIWHHGITPDVEAPLPRGADVLRPDDQAELTAEALAKSGDRQLQKALELLRDQQ